ncbi:hypothetical protein SCB49_06057 [unidentified eubacterium SCB49]|nr:hypothetical protein SCB49_06057 [unidentified eubacterium SCB49]
MKNIFLACIALFVITLSSCDNNQKTTKILKESVGKINGLQIVIDNELWNGPVGEIIRERFAAPTDGLPQDEPLFSMRQMTPEAFTGFARTSRLFLHVSLGNEEKVGLNNEVYASPQMGAVVEALTEEGLVKQLEENSDAIINSFKEAEIKERQRRTNIQLLPVPSLVEKMGVTMRLPSAYRFVRENDDFFWLRKNLKSGSTNIIVYQVPLNTIRKDSAIADIIKMRDTTGSSLMPVEEGGLFITEGAYAPYLFETELDGKFTYETKGIWEVKDQYMAGPFVNYAVMDEENDRWLILEGFVYAPSEEKRDLQFELISILKSAALKN